jgi:hypothetical protein
VFGQINLQVRNSNETTQMHPEKGEDGENKYTNVVEMISDDPNALKSKANDLCRLMELSLHLGAADIQSREIKKLNQTTNG